MTYADYTDRKSTKYDLKRCMTEALLANDRDWLHRLTEGEIGQPLGIRVPGWSQVEADMPAEAVSAARRILAEHLPAEMLYRVETEDIATVCAALARCFHTSEPAAFVQQELRGFDDVLRELGAMVHRRDDGHHYIEWGDRGDGDQTLVPWFSDVLDELASELHRRAVEALAH